MRFSIKLLLGIIAVTAVAACTSSNSSDTSASRSIAGKSRALLDRAVPTDNARARRAGFLDGEKVYFVTEVDGRQVSYGYSVRSRTTFNERAAVMTETQQTYDVVLRSNQRLQQVDYRKVISDAETGVSLYLTENVTKNGLTETRTVTISGERALFRTPGLISGNEDIAVPAGVLFAVTPEWIIAQKPQIGANYSAAVLDRDKKAVVTENVQILNIASTEVMGVTMDVWEADIRREGASAATRMTFTANGDLVSMHSDNIVMRVAQADVAQRDYAKIQVVNSVPVSFQVPAWDNFNVLSYRLLPADRWGTFIQNNRYQQLVNNEVRLTKNAPAVGKVNFPLTVAGDMQAFCRPGENILSEDSEIRERAQAIVNKEVRVIPALALLAGWVHQNIALDAGVSNEDPRASIKLRRGDAADHARVFASLARSLNIPTRLCGGLLVQRENAVRHFWCESFLNGQWLPIDTTVNRVGLPAGYILTETEENGSGVLPAKFAWAVREGVLGLEFVSATKNYAVESGREPLEFTLFPDSKKTYVAFHGNWLANLYWGFSVVKPEDWKGNLNLQAVTINSADGQAVIKIEALNKVFPCTRSQLDLVNGSLANTLTDFKVINSELVRFGVRRNNAMFTDFVVSRDGMRRRCQMYIIPMRGRSYRVSVWASAEKFEEWLNTFAAILATVSL